MASNEQKFKKFMGYSKSRKLVFCSSFNKDKLSISVDSYYECRKKKRLYLLEIDSRNETKVLVGQYLLINKLFNENKLIKQKNYKITNVVFVVIHYYKDFNIKRTLNYLKFIEEKYGTKMKFAAFHISKIKSKNSFIKQLQQI